MTMMTISMIMRHLTGFKTVFFGFKPLEHSVIVAEVGGRTVSNGAAGQGSAVWLSCSLDGNASSVHGVETQQGEVERGHVQLHTAFIVTLKVPNQSLRYSNWQFSWFPWSPIVMMSSTVVTISTAFHKAMVVVMIVVMVVVMVMVMVVVMVMVMVSTAFHKAVVVVMIVVMVMVMVMVSIAFHKAVAVFMIVFVIVVMVMVMVMLSIAFHKAVAVFMIVFVIMVMVVASTAFYNMVLAVVVTMVAMVVAALFPTVFHFWWRHFESAASCCACVGGVAPPVDAELVLVTMVIYVTI